MPFRNCHYCGNITDTWCAPCTEAFQHRTSAERLSVEQKVAELRDFLEQPMEIPFDLVRTRVDAILGRPMFSHEAARPDLLYAEVERERTASFSEIAAKIPADKRIILVVDEPSGAVEVAS